MIAGDQKPVKSHLLANRHLAMIKFRCMSAGGEGMGEALLEEVRKRCCIRGVGLVSMQSNGDRAIEVLRVVGM